MSDDLELILSEMYKTLRELKYPDLTKANPSNFATTILSGENRIALLTWLLTEEMESAKDTLEALTGNALQDKLVEYYTDLGICIRRDSLLGTCDIKQQISTLKFLLDFMKYVRLEIPQGEPEPKISIDYILKTYFSEDATPLSNPQSTLTYEEALKYFASIKEELKNNSNESETNEQELKEVEASESNTETQTPEKSCEERNKLLITEMENFSKLFTIPKESSSENNRNSWDEPIQGIHKNFAKLKEVLRINEELTKINIVNLTPKAGTELDKLIENIVISCEEARNI